MRIVIIIALAVGLFASMSDFGVLKTLYSKAVLEGKLQGIVNCVEVKSNELVSQTATRNACASGFEVDVSTFDINGRASVKKARGEAVIEATLINETRDTVLTWVEIEYARFNEKGEKKVHLSRSNIWIEPNSSGQFNSTLIGMAPEDFEEVTSCNDLKDRKDCWAWTVGSSKGVSMN